MTITKEGALASFYTVNKAPIKHLRVYFSPKQAGSGTASPENVREISGWNGIDLSFTGKNMFKFVKDPFGPPASWYNGNSGWFQNYIIPPSLYGKTFKYSVFIDATNADGTNHNAAKLWAKNKSGNWILIGSEGNNITRGNKGISAIGVTIANDTWDNITFGLTLEKGAIASHPIVELGSTVTEYEPYKGSLRTIDWSNDIGTIYGGYIDLITGELVSQYGFFSTTWGAGLNNTILGANERRGFYSSSIIFDTSSNLHANGQGPYQAVKTTMCNAAFWAWDYNSDTTHYYINEHDINVMLPIGTDNNLILNFCAKLKNPQTIATLTPLELQTFLGRNNIWSNADRIEVEYDLAESNDELYRRRNILLQGAPHIESATGAIANFSTDMAAPLKECKVHFEPVQEGSGDASLENVREINGWSNANLYQTGYNLVDLSTATFTNNSSNIDTTIVNNTITVTSKKHLENYNSQATMIWEIQPALRGKSVYFGCSSITHNNDNHNSTIVCEFRNASNQRISDPTVIALASNLYGKKYTIPENAVKAELYFRIAQNVGTYNVEINDYVTYTNFYIKYPDTPSGYTEYNGNIIPITFPIIGKNLFDKNAIPYQTGKYIYDVVGGIPQYSNNSHYNVYRIPIKPATTYTFGPIKGGSSGSGPIWATTHEDGITSRYVFNAGGSEGITHTFTSYSSDRYLLLSVAIDDEYGYKCNDILQVEEGSTATTYEPYNYFYGGYIDLLAGEIVQEYQYVYLGETMYPIINNRGSNGGYVNSTVVSNDGGRHLYFELGWTNSQPQYNQYLCDASKRNLALMDCKTRNTSVVTNNDSTRVITLDQFVLNTNTSVDYEGDLLVYCRFTFPSTCNTLELKRAYLKDHPMQLIYPLKHPIHYPLTPQIIKSLKGTNNIWANTNGSIDIKYWTH